MFVERTLGDSCESRTLVSLVLGVTPAEVSISGERALTQEEYHLVVQAAQRRAQGEPLAYATGKAPFRELVLDVDSRVLIPRPETEILVDEVLRLTRDSVGGTAVDMGTGSGAIALSLANEGAFDKVVATDISPAALSVAMLNAERYCVELRPEFRLGDGFSALEGVKARVLASNPPYIAYDEASQLPSSVADWEPPSALFADSGGMAMYDMLFGQAHDYLEPNGWLVLEVDARRAELTAQRATDAGRYKNVRLIRDLTGRQRILTAQLSN